MERSLIGRIKGELEGDYLNPPPDIMAIYYRCVNTIAELAALPAYTYANELKVIRELECVYVIRIGNVTNKKEKLCGFELIKKEEPDDLIIDTPVYRFGGYEFNEHDVCLNPTEILFIDQGNVTCRLAICQCEEDWWDFEYNIRYRDSYSSGPATKKGGAFKPGKMLKKELLK